MSEALTALPPTRRRRSLFVTIVRHVWELAPMGLVHIGAVAGLVIGGTWGDWLLLPVLMYVRGAISTIGYHRYFAHRSFKTSRVAQFILGCLCCANLQQGPIWWALYHRQHHRHSDDADDPHSPHHGGFLWAYCGWLFVPLEPDWRGVSDLRRYPELLWLERFWQVPGVLLAALSWWVGGWSFLCIGFCMSAVAIFHMTFVVNSLGHLIGSRRYPTKDHSRNSWPLAALSLGDGWHNNHHHYPHAAQAGFFWWEIDGAYRVIRFLEWLGIVWGVRRVPPHKLDPQEDGITAREDHAAVPKATVS